ncbi:hypothetical protein [Hymenobacter sp. CRA2]|uniref:hypothetical protein n=1 Tax=Hymenobacter sp. CRA2 TaxID=1955620 RepID=UPI00098FB229|nr:hypothetical protein [Hymenobacter sp. CRA2]OON68255.1 hypothetical protein B0919_13960 [Hymenobacter sp. CRA2]
MTKKLLLPLIAVLLLGVGACKKINELLTFYIEDSQAFQLPASPLVGQLPLLAFPVQFNSAEEYRKANTAANLVKDVSLNKLTLDISGPSNANFDFLENVAVYISLDPSERTLLASLDQVPMGVKTIELRSSNAKLDKYLKTDQYILSVETRFRSPLTQNTDMSINYKFKVTADPL